MRSVIDFKPLESAKLKTLLSVHQDRLNMAAFSFPAFRGKCLLAPMMSLPF